MKDVVIIGAGIAGMTAALRLAERGYKVTIYEQSPYVGGKWRAVEWKREGSSKSAFHEHSYHLYLNWYHNFWRIADEIGVRRNFTPLTKVHFLRQGEFPRMRELENFGSLSTLFKNLFSGVVPPADMFLYMYSVIEMLATPMRRSRFSDLISVNGFVSTRPYSTDASVSMYDRYLAKTFAVASYRASAQAFQTFLDYNTVRPAPQFHIIKGDCFTYFLQPLEDRLVSLGVDIVKNATVTDLKLSKGGRVKEIAYVDSPHDYCTSDITLQEWMDQDAGATPRKKVKIKGSLIFAIPPHHLERFMDQGVYRANPELGEASKLNSEPMASVHLHFNAKFRKRLKREGVSDLPREPVLLVDSEYKLSFIDNSRLWPDIDEPYLNVVASDSRPLDALEPPREFTCDRDPLDGDGRRDIDLENPRTALDFILHELRKYLYFEKDEIEIDLLEIDRNVGRELFIDETGAWQWRPETVSGIDNLFLAGDYCKTPIEVVSLEGAVVSGLQAAEAVRQRHGRGKPIPIATPKKYPHMLYWPALAALAPYAATARMWTIAEEIAKKFKTDR